MSNGEVLNISITTNKDNGGYKNYTTVYKNKVQLKDKERLADCFISLKKYGLDFEEVYLIMKRQEVNDFMFHKENEKI